MNTATDSMCRLNNLTRDASEVSLYKERGWNILARAHTQRKNRYHITISSTKSCRITYIRILPTTCTATF